MMINWCDYSAGNHRITCPHCGKGPSDKSAGLTINSDLSGVIHCFRCRYVEYRKNEHSTFRRESFKRHASSTSSEKRNSLSEWGWSIWNQCLPLGGIAADYLRSRRCALPPNDGHLRWHPNLKHVSGYVGPALVALVTNVATRAELSLHRTWITATGKASVNPPRMQLAGHSLANGVIRLWPDDFVNSGLGIAEGIETALSLAHGYQPVWSVIDANHMASMPVIPSVEVLMIAKDNDPAGRKAAIACAKRWTAAGKKVLITTQAANDINDCLKDAA
jgi:putative DNA primase/helicase